MIQQSADVIKSRLIDELESSIPKSAIGDHGEEKADEVKDLLSRFAQINGINKWEDTLRKDARSANSWVFNIFSSMQNELKHGHNSGIMTYYLQVMKCLGYVNTHAKDYFLEHIFESLNNDEVEMMWHTLIESEEEFRTSLMRRGAVDSASEAESGMDENPSLYPGRYNNFLEQLHFGKPLPLCNYLIGTISQRRTLMFDLSSYIKNGPRPMRDVVIFKLSRR